MIRALTLVAVIMNVIELIEMKEPFVQSYRVPIPLEEKEQTGFVNLVASAKSVGEIGMYFGIRTVINGLVLEVPP